MSGFKYTLVLILLFFFSAEMFSQKIFREGYIVKKTGESFTGLVEYAPDKSIPSACHFKRFDIAVEITLYPGDLKAFGYKNGKRFESLSIDGKESFYETIVKGELTLYLKGSKYYIQKIDGFPVELKSGKLTLKEGETLHEFNSPAELLRFLTSGKEVRIKEKLNLKTDVVPVVVEYNSKSDRSFNVFNREFSEKELTSQAWRSGVNRNKFGVKGGVSSYSLSIVSNSKSTGYLPTSVSNIGPIFGMSYERVLSRKSDRFVVRIDLLIQKQAFYSYSEGTSSSVYQYRDDAFFGFTGLKVPVLFEYSINGNRVIPFINGGFSSTFLIKKDYLHINEIEYPTKDIYTSQDQNMGFNSLELGLVAGAGVKIRLLNKISLTLEGRFEYGSGPFKVNYLVNSAFKENSNQYSIVLGLNF